MCREGRIHVLQDCTETDSASSVLRWAISLKHLFEPVCVSQTGCDMRPTTISPRQWRPPVAEKRDGL